jgi:hypothetical protein
MTESGEYMLDVGNCEAIWVECARCGKNRDSADLPTSWLLIDNCYYIEVKDLQYALCTSCAKAFHAWVKDTRITLSPRARRRK